MLKKTIKYTNFFGVESTDDYYFNLTKNELINLNAGSFRQKIESMQKGESSSEEIITTLHDFILYSYGKVSMDGNRFEKSDDLRKEFEQSAAYDALFMELATDTKSLNDFMVNIMPTDLQESFRVEVAKQTANIETLK